MGEATQEVLNQPGPPEIGDPWAADRALREAAAATGAEAERLAAYGAALGQPGIRAAARGAERRPPELIRFDRAGRRIDEVEFHPGYHALLDLGLGHGYAAGPWTGGRHATHAAMVYLHSQIEPASCCPMTMTYAAVPALAAEPRLEAVWRPRLTAAAYDPASRPAEGKRAATMGMAMTEKQGGSDLRSNATLAEPADGAWRLTGHKWFCSAPMSDGFLTLGRTAGGLTCFLVPRFRPDGSLNGVHLMRLKDKLGNRANASAEIEYQGAFAERLGEEGRGIATILDMVHHTRLDTAMAPAGLMRAALAEAWHWVTHRTAFQKRLIDQPLMAGVLADLSLDWQGALALGLRVARAFDGDGPEDRAFARVAVALAKFHNNKLCVNLVYECMEALGGMGYVEDTPLPMLYREAPLNSIWEGSGNVICLDILRSLDRDALAAERLAAELDAARGEDRRYDAALAEHRSRWPALPQEAEARWFAEQTASLLAASVLLRQAPGAVAGGYVRSRVAGPRGGVAGAIGGLDTGALLAALSPSG